MVDGWAGNGQVVLDVPNRVRDVVLDPVPELEISPELVEVAPPEAAPLDAAKTYRRIGLSLIASDALCITAALLIAYYTRFGLWSLPSDYLLVLLGAPFLWLAVFHSFSLHAPQQLSPPEEFRRIVGAVSMAMVVLVMASFWSKSSASYSRTWVGLTWVLAIAFELTARQVWRWYEGHLRKSGRLALRTLIVGTNEEAGRLALNLSQHGSGYAPMGFVAHSTPYIVPDGLPLVGKIDDLEQVIREQAPDCVFVAMTDLRSHEVLQVAQVSRKQGVPLRLSVNLPEMLSTRLSFHSIGSDMALSVRPVRLSGARAVLKRAFDFSLATTALIVTLPLSVVISIAIKLSSPGPVLFRQERITKGGRAFTMYKFRTMVAHADQLFEEQSMDKTVPFFKIREDVGFTKVGRFLRRFSLDELPQLVNVAKGDMSIVGPRPLPAEQVAANQDLLGPRHEVLAGVTGWWQINGRSDVSPKEAVRLDVFYIENWSLALDLYILWRTLGVLLARKGAY
jgi:exopolysaccharide biosynthesis polyprenyl glycosylphosphotransferase